jgi:homoserine dehydrogenase
VREVKVILVGFGKIGRGVAGSLAEKGAHLRRMGLDFRVVAACEHCGCVVDERGLDLGKLLSGKVKWGPRKTLDVLREVDADLAVEMTPGNIRTGQPGLSHIRAALESGKHVVTSNKSPLVVAYRQLSGLAARRGLQLRFEATVGGAIPVINTCTNELKSNTIMNVYGILNGTTNYILSKMGEEGVDFEAALKEAQSLGFAEPNPEYDVKGIDTAAKVIILANSLMGSRLRLRDLTVVGVDGVTHEAVELAKEYGYAVKLIGDVAGRSVGPRLIPVEHPLNVPGSLNAILVETDTAGDITLIGAGAGPKETSSAVIGDMISVAECL